MDAKALAERFDSIELDQAEKIKLDFAVAIVNEIKQLGLSRKEFALRLKTSPAWVTKVLRGDVNLTIETMAKLCDALASDMEIKILKRKAGAIESAALTAEMPVQLTNFATEM